jgi:hypothetical protein
LLSSGRLHPVREVVHCQYPQLPSEVACSFCLGDVVAFIGLLLLGHTSTLQKYSFAESTDLSGSKRLVDQ